MKVLAIESSCDETSVAVIENSQVKSNIISSQYFHTKFGGVVPELASRAHIKSISTVCKEALSASATNIEDIDAFSVTTQPGLSGSLIVGSNFAKGLALKYKKPIVPVNHIEGHLYSGCLQDSAVSFPFISLVVSGGHTLLYIVHSYSKYVLLGSTIDDAAGEAFDKVASMLGLGYPGGPQIDMLAQNGDPNKYSFPRSMLDKPNYDFSFSGLKTSVKYFLAEHFPDGADKAQLSDIAASFQEAVVDVLVQKCIKAANEYSAKYIIISGGVSANSHLRQKIAKTAETNNKKVVCPDMSFCMDNAAMIGFIAEKKLSQGIENYFDLSFTVDPTAIRRNKLQNRT